MRFISRISGQTTRIRYIDIMKGITILLVMVGHYFNNRLVSTFIWSFHMPLFLFISGYFFRDLPIRQRIHKAFVSILMPYWITIFAMSVLEGIYFLIQNHLGFGSVSVLRMVAKRIFSGFFVFASDFGVPFKPEHIPTVYALWFLGALFVGEIYLALLLKLKNVYLRLIILLYAVFFSKWLITWTFIPLGLHYGTVFAAWLYVGYLYRNDPRFIITPAAEKILIVLWFLIALFEYKADYRFDINQFLYSFYGFELLSAFGGILFIKRISQWMERFSPFLTNFFAYIGSKTIWILCVHATDQALLSHFIHSIPVSTRVLIPCRFLLDLVLALLLNWGWRGIRMHLRNNS